MASLALAALLGLGGLVPAPAGAQELPACGPDAQGPVLAAPLEMRVAGAPDYRRLILDTQVESAYGAVALIAEVVDGQGKVLGAPGRAYGRTNLHALGYNRWSGVVPVSAAAGAGPYAVRLRLVDNNGFVNTYSPDGDRYVLIQFNPVSGFSTRCRTALPVARFEP